jgi:DNA-binding CsgD family transcriptional regulator/sugar-specific transcriptional regulator TrmB
VPSASPDGDSTSPSLLTRFGVAPEAEAVWQTLLEEPLISLNELSTRTDLPVEALRVALQTLIDAELVRPSGVPTGHTALDPSIAVDAHIVRAERELGAELDDLASLRHQIPVLASRYARGRAAAGDEPGFEIVLEQDDVERQAFIAADLTRDVTRNMMLKQTVDGRRIARPVDTALLARGVMLLTIVGSNELDDPDFYSELMIAHELGEQFRTIQQVPTRMIIGDRHSAILPIDPDNIDHGAIFVRVRSLIDVLIFMFDRLWADATPLFTDVSGFDGPVGRTMRVLELLAVGYTDVRIARTLGLAERTVRREVSDLKDTLAVSSRTEIVAAAFRRQWL